MRSELAHATGLRHVMLAAELQLREIGLGVAQPRIPQPHNAQERWAQHKYSILARDPEAYRAFGQRVAASVDEGTLEDDLADAMEATPAPEHLRGAIEHMWGYVSDVADTEERRLAAAGPEGMFAATQWIAIRTEQRYLLASTALSELRAFLPVET